MPVSAAEIESKEFLVTLRGYDKDQVAEFLQVVAAHVRSLESKLARASERSAAASDEQAGSDPFAVVGGEVAGVLRAAADAADHARRDAEQEAQRLRQAAIAEAGDLMRVARADTAEMLERARTEADGLLQDAIVRHDRLTAEVADLRERLRTALAAIDGPDPAAEVDLTVAAGAVAAGAANGRKATSGERSR